jgi:hypothetical protein
LETVDKKEKGREKIEKIWSIPFSFFFFPSSFLFNLAIVVNLRSHKLRARDTRPYQSIVGIGFAGYLLGRSFNFW